MLIWLDRVLMISIAILVVILTITPLSTFVDQPMAGRALMMHMMAGGVLVVALPLVALVYLSRMLAPRGGEAVMGIGYWLLIVTGLVTIASVVLCMMPWLSTDQMQLAIEIHGYAGFAATAAWLVFFAGWLRMRRIQATRSATPG